MAKSFKSENKNRIKFKKGGQRSFLSLTKGRSDKTWSELANLAGVSVKTLLDWRREKFLMSYGALKNICELMRLPIPKDIIIYNQFWYVNKGAKLGGLAVLKKYGVIGGDKENRKSGWRKWWDNKGRFIIKPPLRRKPVKKPRKSTALAEFAGILLGDGRISRRQICITLNSISDQKYKYFIVKIIKNLFGVTPGVYYDSEDSVCDIVVSRTSLVDFCVNVMGLKIGNKIKNQVDIPEWIKRDKNFRIACLRGLVDTDGSVFTHRYKVKRRWYKYKKLSFTSYSKPLVSSVYNILSDLGVKPRIADGCDVRLDSIKDMETFFNVVGTNNLKHWQNYKK